MIGGAVGVDADRHDHRNEAARQQQVDDVGIDALDVADEAEVGRVAPPASARQHHRPRVDEAAVLAVDADGLAAMAVDQSDQLLVDLAQHHLDHVQRRLVGDANAAMLAVGMPICSQQLVDAPAAAVHDDRDSCRRAAAVRRRARSPSFSTGSAIAPPPKRTISVLRVVAANERQRLGQDARLLCRR